MQSLESILAGSSPCWLHILGAPLPQSSVVVTDVYRYASLSPSSLRFFM